MISEDYWFLFKENESYTPIFSCTEIFYLDLYSKINDSINTVEKEAVEKPVKQIIKKNENNYSQKVKTAFLLAGITVLLIVVTALVFWFFHKKKLKKKYEAIIDNLKASNIAITETPIEVQKAEDENQASVNIADDTLKTILKRLEKFESSNRFTNRM
ncbi:MAG TPA: hypothetical protein DD740_04640 [Chryseobacterium sp.]|nr:hypothetical protein [Chryseobacterium sp.]